MIRLKTYAVGVLAMRCQQKTAERYPSPFTRLVRVFLEDLVDEHTRDILRNKKAQGPKQTYALEVARMRRYQRIYNKSEGHTCFIRAVEQELKVDKLTHTYLDEKEESEE